MHKWVCGWLGACVGVVVLAYNRNPEQTVAGLVVGLPLGAIALPLVSVVVLLLFVAIWRRQ